MSVAERRTPVRSSRHEGLMLIGAMIVLMWLVEVIDTLDSHRLDQWGIEPRHLDGLVGIVAAPFLHAGFGHLIGNTVPFALMGSAIAFSGLQRVLEVTVIVGFIGGLGTWLFAPEHTIHIGASGLVFGFASYLILRGFFDRSAIELGVGLVVVVVWGGSLLFSLTPHPGISWQGHLFGGIGGIVAARVLAKERRRATASPR